jgi:hypothetical protein
MNRAIQSILDRRAPKMDIHYMSDGEDNAIMKLDDVLANFRDANVKFYEEDIRNELNSRGWYEGTHECGRYLILNISKTELQPKAYWR